MRASELPKKSGTYYGKHSLPILSVEPSGRVNKLRRRRQCGQAEQVESFDGYISQYIPSLISGTFLPIAFAIVIIPVDWVAGLLLPITAPLIPVFMALVGWGAETASRRHLEAFARLSGFFADRIRGLSTFKLYGQAEAEGDKVVEASKILRDKTMPVLRIAFSPQPPWNFLPRWALQGPPYTLSNLLRIH